jgi:serine/threonine protein kinase
MRQPIPFGKYLLLERISVGGMAEVFKAKSFGVEGFEKILAIKRILPSMAEDQEFIEMFIDEAKIAGQLSHANICQIFELGRIGDSHFIAMEYVWGKDLLQIQNRFRRLKQQMQPVMAAFCASKICEGLDYAHRKKDAQGKALGIIHRDVSPQNVLVSYEGEVKMIDFGIAKAVGRSSKTQAGVLKGKFGYMSPEQVRGLPIDRRSDVFAIGTILHELLTGERLFVAESDFATLEKVRNVDVRAPRVINPKVPETLDRVVMRALSRNPDERYQWANELQEDLQSFLMQQEPVFTAKHLSQFMKETFVAELRREQMLLETYKRVGRDGRLPADAAPPANAAASGMPRLTLQGPGALRPIPPPPTPASKPPVPPAAAARAAAPLPEIAQSGSFDTEPTTIDGGPQMFDEAEPTTTAPAMAKAAQVPRSGEFEEEEAPTDIFDETLAPAVSQSKPTIDPALAAQPTVIFANDGQPVQASGSVIIESQPNPSQISLLDTAPKGAPAIQLPPQARGPTVWKDILIGVAVAAVVLLGAVGIRAMMRRGEPSGRAMLVVAVLVPRDAEVHVRGAGGDHPDKLTSDKTAATFKGLPPGPYDIEVASEGVPPFKKRVELRSGDAEVVTAVFGESLAGQLRLKVTPENSSVWVDGAEMSADEPIALRVGKHDVRVAKSGFQEERFVVDMHSGEQIDKTIGLQALRGVIEVASDPDGADVFVNGHAHGRTPTTIEDLELGKTYRVHVRRNGFQPATKAVPLDGERRHEKVELTLAEAHEVGKAIADKEEKEKPAEKKAKPQGEAKEKEKEKVAAAGGKGGAIPVMHLDTGPSETPKEKATPASDGAAAAGGGTGDGFLIANTQPWARVLIDGHDTGKSTPIAPRSKVALKPGKHMVTFVVGGKKFDYEIVVRPGEDTRLIRKLDVAP